MILTPRNIQLVRPSSSCVFLDADVVIGVGLYNQGAVITRCLDSIFEQDRQDRKLAVVLLDDQSSDNWEEQTGDLLCRPEMVVLKGNCGTPARTRNAILDFVDENFPKAKWIARLDADDCFTCVSSLAAACSKGEETNARYVLGGNRLVRNGEVIRKENPATQDLLNGESVLSILKEMADGTARNELPSCNLLLAARSGWRYPDVRSAEDHWLVADLLLNHGHDGAILESPYYCDYTLDGAETHRNTAESSHTVARQRLYEAAVTWGFVKSLGGDMLGHGQEGVVRQIDDYVEKHFYPGILSDADIVVLKKIVAEATPFLPSPEWHYQEDRWLARYHCLPTEPVSHISIDQAGEFLAFCLAKGFVCKNIKRDNFRVTSDGRLFMTDIGKDVVPMRADFFRDSAARLYAIAAWNCSDGEYLRRKDDRRQEDVLSEIPGFEDFYHELVLSHARAHWRNTPCTDPIELPRAEDISLLIKCCAMDADFLECQVRYIVALLSKPRSFLEVILLVDPYSGPFLRQHCSGDFELLLKKARGLREDGLVDRLIIAPEDEETVQGVNARWFDLECSALRTVHNAPVASQLWGFEQVRSRYVLQCDVDVLIGRRDLEHDYLSEMLVACSGQKDVLGVAFNIPYPAGIRNPYHARPGDYVPEVRCGLLDLHRTMACLPLPNRVSDGALHLTWHRSLQQSQRQNALRTLRGGDARTFYIHPENHWKRDPDHLAVIRDLTAQGDLPRCQMNQWDLRGKKGAWSYPRRGEDIVFLLKGRNTPAEKLKRCIASLKMQDDQTFGLVVIDDASDVTDVTLLQHYLKPFAARCTLIRRPSQVGRIPNFITGLRDICVYPETLIVILDLDDALINPKTVSMLREKWVFGHDVILGGVFRPDKPLKLYSPSFDDIRRKWGGDVWIHLRSFRKRLFDAIPDEVLQIDGDWIGECTDYATMIPMAEAASFPTFMPEYLYCHEPTTARTPEVRLYKEHLIRSILSKQPQMLQEGLA
jgi:glycosyltransferase involved in cell wall biosynthesis